MVNLRSDLNILKIILLIIALSKEVLCAIKVGTTKQLRENLDSIGLPPNCGKRYAGGDTDFPWLVKLLYNYPKVTRCGGVLLSDQWVLSSEDCLKSDLLQAVMVGDYDTGDDWDCLRIEWTDKAQRILVGNKYFRSEFEMGVVNLHHPARFTTWVNRVCISVGRSVPMGRIGKVAGWTYRDPYMETYNGDLKVADMKVIKPELCATILNKTIQPHQFCAQPTRVELPCVGMPGGPFMDLLHHTSGSRYYATGIMVSKDIECVGGTLPMVFTAIENIWLWLDDVVVAPVYERVTDKNSL